MMKIIVAQKYRHLSRLIVIALSAIALASCGNRPSALATQTQPGNSGQTFADWCREKADLNPDAKHTVEVLLLIAGTNDCNGADRELSSLTELSVDTNEISDLKPLESFTKLKELDLGWNKISDLKPLKSLTNLTVLKLHDNQISDIKPLESLTNLKRLNLHTNKIIDIQPLES